MQFIKQIKSYFLNKKIQSVFKNRKANLQLMDFADTKNIGIVFDGTDYEMVTAIRDLEMKFKKEGKTVTLFGYINTNDDKKQDFLITNKNLNFFGYPSKNQFFDFAKKEFDYLFGFFNDIDSPLNVIFALSNSKLRIGTSYGQDINLFDIIVESSNIKSTEDIVKSLTQFTFKIRTK